MSYNNQNGNENNGRYPEYDSPRRKNRVIVAICIAISALALVGIVCLGFLGFVLFKNGTVNIADHVGKGYLLKEESVSMPNIEELQLDVTFHNVHVNTVNGNELRVRQYGPENLGSEDQFSLKKNPGKVKIEIRKVRFIPSTFNIGQENRIELDIPKSWIGSVYLTTESGSMLIGDSFNWENVNLKSASGSITVNGTVTCDNIKATSASGSIDMKNIMRADSITLKSSSGYINTANNIMADDITIKSVSGSITFDNSIINSDSARIESTSGRIKGNSVSADKYEIESTSGSININNINGHGKIDCTSGSISVNTLLLTGDTSIHSVSGSINIGVPKNLSFNLKGSTTSGSINTNFSVNYKDDKKRSLSAAIGKEPFVDLSVKTTSGGININQYN